jgi:hypothetical protein
VLPLRLENRETGSHGFLKNIAEGGRMRGNQQLTAAAAILLLVLLAAEGVTLLNLGALMSVHAFVGVLLIPLVALKLGSVGWRMLSYYRGRAEYVEAGPPQMALRVLVGPVIIASTILLLGTGVALMALGQTQGTVVLLHKASFAVWLGATGIHVLAHVWKLRAALVQRVPGIAGRSILVGATVLASSALAVATLPAADHLQDHMSAQVGLDAH